MTKEAIGLRIKSIREKLGLNQKQLAKLLKKSNSAVSGYEVGNSYPSIYTLSKIAEISGVSIAWIILGDNLVGSLDKLLPEDDLRLLKAFHQASEEDRKFMLRAAELIAGEGKKLG